MDRRDTPFYIMVIGISLLVGTVAYVQIIAPWMESSITDDDIDLVFLPENARTSLTLTDFHGKSNVYKLTGGSLVEDAIAESIFTEKAVGTIEMFVFFTNSKIRTSFKFLSDELGVVNYTQESSLITNRWLTLKIVFNANTNKYSVYVNGIVRTYNNVFIAIPSDDIDVFQVSIPAGVDNIVYFKLISFT